MTANKFLKPDVAQHAKAFGDNTSEAQYDVAVKVACNGCKLPGLEPAQAAKGAGEDAEGVAQGEGDVAAVRKKFPKRPKKWCAIAVEASQAEGYRDGCILV